MGDELKQIQSRRNQHIHVGGVCIRCDQLHPCQVLLVDMLAESQQRVARLEAALRAAGVDLISDLGYFERRGSLGTVASIQRTLDKIDAALDGPEPAAEGGEG